MTPQLIISLSPQGELVAELPGLNGARRKVELQKESQFALACENAIECIKAFQSYQELENEYNFLAGKTTHVGSKEEKEKLMAETKLNAAKLKLQSANSTIAALQNVLSQNDTTTGIISQILEGQLTSKSRLGEDGAPTAQQLRHWEKHSGIWGDPSCPFCIAEGKFEKGKNRERSVRGLSEYEALRCGLISRGYSESKTKSGLWTKQNMGNIYLLPNGKVQDSKRVQWLDTHRTALIQDGKIHAKQFGFTPVPKPIKHQGTQVKKLVKMVKTTNQERIVKKLGNIIL
jgi:hypothetical protein